VVVVKRKRGEERGERREERGERREERGERGDVWRVVVTLTGHIRNVVNWAFVTQFF
jgi:hypothetical protein